MADWTFLTNHAHVLLCVAADPDMRLRDVAERVGITERATQRIVADLIQAGYVSSQKTGRRNRYEIHPDLPFRHPTQGHRQVGILVTLLGGSPEQVSEPAGARPAPRAKPRTRVRSDRAR